MVNWDYFKHYFSVDLLTKAEMQVMRNFILMRTKRTSPCIIEEQTTSIISK